MSIITANVTERANRYAFFFKPLLEHQTFFWFLFLLIFGAGFFYAYMSLQAEETGLRFYKDYFEDIARKHTLFFGAAAIYLTFYLFVGLFTYALFCRKRQRPLPFPLGYIPKAYIKYALQGMGCLACVLSFYLLFLLSQKCLYNDYG